MKNKLYIAKYSSGSYDDLYFVSVFVSKDKEFVEKWVEKFNTKLDYWKEYFKQFKNEYGALKGEFYDKVNNSTYYTVTECNKAFIDEIEFRNPRKKEDKTDE